MAGIDDIPELIEHQEYATVVEILRAELTQTPHKLVLRHQLADVLAIAGETKESAELFGTLAEDYARNGAPAKAITVLKKMQQLDPSRLHQGDARIAQLSKERDQAIERERWKGRRADTLPVAAPDDLTPLELELDTEVKPHQKEEKHLNGGMELELATEAPGDALTSSPLFSDFSADELLAVIRGLRLVTAEPGDILVTEGAPGNSLFILTSGTVKVFVRDAGGDNHPIRKMTEGTFFGEVSILTGRPRSATIVAATACELLELDRETLDTISKTHPRVMEVLQSFCAMRLGSASETQARKAGRRS